ncbi:MAG: quinolinate synthase NadA [Candidatus Omnitrophica bacterium]|nr:quinolinate synthase NadA [Candidatus Omnitrophota bacterium]
MKSYTQKDDKQYKDQLKERIKKIKKQRNAVLIAHNYQRDEIQEIADICGDSLALSKAVVDTKADVIVFCGVLFMAETASILNPKKTVLLPVKEAGCPMVDMITVEMLQKKKKQHPDAVVVAYINTSAAVKAESDICCTSSNAVEVVRSLKQKQVIFVPDKNLGSYVQSKIPEKEIILWEGFCPCHMRVHEGQIKQARKLYPNAEFLTHPECEASVVALADHVTSTAGMIKYVGKSKAKEFIIGTECGILYQLKKQHPDRKFYIPTDGLVCADMKLTTLGWVLHSLEYLKTKIQVPDNIRVKAKKAIDKMIEIPGV